MATVYVAEDLRHHRKVALKVMRSKVAATLGADRFLREIEIAARLAHPHILPVHDSGDADGFLYYVMPLLEGETLRSRLVREGELPIPDAVRIIRDVSDALAYAHRHGVVHRDIKPDNIMLAGRHALVMDFGVAKALREAASGRTLTTMGVSLGTPAYMAPEQAAGDANLDHRADVYSLGIVAYEMLTGEPPFHATSPQAVMTKHITEEPRPVSERRSSVPAALDQLVTRALRKKPADRWQSAEELLRQLEFLSTPSGGLSPVSAAHLPAPTGAWRRATATAAAVALLAIGGILGWQALSREAGPGAVAPATFRQLTFTGDVGASAISPDGRYVAYARLLPDSGPQLWVQEVAGAGQPLRLAPGFFPQRIRWSPDGSSVLFYASVTDRQGAAWYTVPLLGGQPRQVTFGAFADLSADGTRAAWGFTAVRRLWIADLDSGDTTSIAVDGTYTWIWDAAWSPGGERIALVLRDEERSRTAIHSLRVDGTSQDVLVEEAAVLATPYWSARGDALYYMRGTGFTAEVWKVRVGDAGTPAGRPGHVMGGLVSGPGGLSVSGDSRRLAYTRSADRANFTLYRLDPARREYALDRELTTGTSLKGLPETSPDGSSFAYSDGDGARRNIFVMPVEGGAPRQVTFAEGAAGDPVWSPTGRSLAFAVASPEGVKLWAVPANGGSPRVFEHASVSPSLSVVWGPGRMILYQVPGNRNYAVLDPATGAERPLVAVDSVGWLFLDAQNATSPDGSAVVGFWNRRPHGYWLISLVDSTMTHLWPREGHLEYWADDSKSVWWHSFEPNEIRRRTFDGATHERARIAWPMDCPAGDFTPDRRLIICRVFEANRDVWLIENFDPAVR